MRPQPMDAIVSSFSASSVSGRPPSTVYSTSSVKSICVRSASMSLRSCADESVVGVPPPIYTVSSRRRSFSAIAAMLCSSCSSLCRYGATRAPLFSVVVETKLQYEQRDGQKGIEIYRL